MSLSSSESGRGLTGKRLILETIMAWDKNQELLIRKQNESDETSRWIEFQKTNLRREKLKKKHLTHP